MEKKHTPGPWRYCKTNGSPTHGEHVIAGAKPGYLAEVRDCGSGDVGANARLIAAAPDLLEALKGVLAIVSDSQGVAGYHLNGNTAEWDEFDEVDAAIDAIAKATGGAA